VILAAGLIASRFVHYLALSILFGGALFPLYGVAPPRTNKQRVPAWLRALLLGAALLATVSGLSWLVFTAAGMSGSLSGITDPAILSMVIRNTDFGRIWVFRLVLATGLVLLLLGRQVPAWRFHAVVFGSLILLASIAWTGHAGSDASSAGLPHRIADASHLVAAGVWVGALVVFSRLTMIAVRQPRDEDLRTLHHALSRFSSVGTIVVVTLVLTGLANPGFLSSFGTAYGQVLLVKLALFGAMLLLAAANRFWLTPRLASTLESALNSEGPTRALRASILAETALAALVLLAVGWLGTLAPVPEK
jgi:putative copper resistance protein D